MTGQSRAGSVPAEGQQRAKAQQSEHLMMAHTSRVGGARDTGGGSSVTGSPLASLLELSWVGLSWMFCSIPQGQFWSCTNAYYEDGKRHDG